MINGVKFQITNGYGRFLKEILEPLNCKNYNYQIGPFFELYKVHDGKLVDISLFNKNYISGVELECFINKYTHYIIFVDLKAYSVGKKFRNISRYKEFLSSDCEFMVFIYDSSYVEIYCKDSNISKALYDNGIRYNFSDLSYIYDVDDNKEMFL